MLEADGSGRPGIQQRLLTFVLLWACLLSWSVATPMYGMPDEPAHAVKAYAIMHGDRGVRDEAGQLEYRVPPEYTDGAICFAGHEQRPSNCLHLSSFGADHRQTTKADGYPPFFYFLVGLPTLLTRQVWGLYLIRGIAAGWVALLLTVAFHNSLEVRKRGPLLVGTALATTPAVFFFGASINPSGMAIAAAMAVWTGGFALLRPNVVPRERLPVALATFAGPLCLFLLLRRDSLVWAGLMVLLLALITRRQRWKELAASRHARAWGAAILVSIGLQLATGRAGTARLMGETAGGTLSGAWHLLPNYIREVGGGVLGWLDSPLPGFVYDVFIGGTVALATASLLLAPRRLRLAVASVATAVVAAPLAVGAIGYAHFQGRYLLPLAVGVALVAGEGLSESDRPEPWPRYLTIGALALVGAAHVVAFAQTLRRFSAGSRGGWFFAHTPSWQPPVLGATTLAVLYAASITAILTWMFVLAGERRRPRAARRDRPLAVDRQA